jgi:hypothetical protein
VSDDKAVVKETNDPVLDAAVEKRTDDVADLDTLISQFEEGTKQTAVSQPEPKQPAIDPATIERIKRVESRLLEEDINGAVKQVFGDMKVSPRVAKGWLDQVARENPAIAKAFLNKANDPVTWNKFAKSLSKEAEKDFSVSKVDEEATADHAAVAAAVRGASTKVAAEPPPDMSKMSDAELRKFTQENWGFSV